MAKKEVSPMVLLPGGQTGAFFSKDCFYCLQAINPAAPKHDVKEPVDPTPWPGLPLSFTANVKAGANRMS